MTNAQIKSSEVMRLAEELIVKQGIDKGAPTGVLCPKCKGHYGSISPLQVRQKVLTLWCVSCGHEWFVEEPSAENH